MEDSDDDLSDEDYIENITLVPLPCDLPTWPDIFVLIKQLEISRTSFDIGQVMEQLEKTVMTSSDNSEDIHEINTMQYFLDEVCADEERNMICSCLIPAIASLALSIYNCKPYIGVLHSRVGEAEARTFHPNFLASILAHSFLSTTGRDSLNLNVLQLDPHEPETHWKLRCYFDHFHQAIQGEKNENITVYKEIFAKDSFAGVKDFANGSLIPFSAVEENKETDIDVLRLGFCDDFSRGIIPCSNPLTSEYNIKHLECLVPFLYIEKLAPAESIRIDLAKKGQVSIIKTPDILRTEKDIKKALQSFLVAMKPCTSYKDNLKSVLRRPSVAAVTSGASESENQQTKSSSKLSLSISDSCIHNHSDSELSYNLSDKEKSSQGRIKYEKKTKLRRKDTFNERLKAALERGNTPDESDDQSTNRPFIKPVPVHKRCLRRQRSTGFRAFNDNFEESDDFFTATEDEHSNTPAKNERVVFKVCTNNASNPLMKRKMLKDKSFDLSTSSAQITSPSLPISSLQTGSSNLFSDSSSFSSEGLGMPKLEDECLEDLCDKLEGCLETSEGCLDLRDTELRRAVKGLGVRSLSDTFMSVIEDMDMLPYVKASRCILSSEERTSTCLIKPSISCPNLSISSNWSIHNGCHGKRGENQTRAVVTQSVTVGGWTRQVWPLLIWISASALGTVKGVTFNTAGHRELEDLGDTVDKLICKNVNSEELLKMVLEFVAGTEEDLFNFIQNKLQIN